MPRLTAVTARSRFARGCLVDLRVLELGREEARLGVTSATRRAVLVGLWTAPATDVLVVRERARMSSLD